MKYLLQETAARKLSLLVSTRRCLYPVRLLLLNASQVCLFVWFVNLFVVL